jgi:hypothetical protein
VARSVLHPLRGGRYRPGTREGDSLPAHEFAHVVQQRRPRSGSDEATALREADAGERRLVGDDEMRRERRVFVLSGSESAIRGANARNEVRGVIDWLVREQNLRRRVLLCSLAVDLVSQIIDAAGRSLLANLPEWRKRILPVVTIVRGPCWLLSSSTPTIRCRPQTVDAC